MLSANDNMYTPEEMKLRKAEIHSKKKKPSGPKLDKVNSLLLKMHQPKKLIISGDNPPKDLDSESELDDSPKNEF